MAEAAVAAPSRGLGRGLVGALLTASLMPLNSTMVAVAVPAIARHFHESPDRVTQALVPTYLITAIALQSPGGKLGDRLGHWRIFAAGQAAIACGAILGFVAPDVIALAGGRVLMAVGGAVAVPATLALLRLEMGQRRPGRAFGTYGAVMSLAAALGPIVGGLLVDAFGWRAVFVANVPVLAVSALLAASVRHPRVPTRRASFDWTGSVLLTLGLALAVLSTEHLGVATLPVLATGVVVLAVFVVWERRASDPVIAFDLFRSVPFAAGSLLIALQNLVMYALVFEIPLLLAKLYHLDARQTGEILLFTTAAMVIMSLVAGRLTELLGVRVLAVAGSLSCLLAVVLLATAGMHSADEVRLPLALLGIGIGLTSPAAQTASLSAIVGERSGMAAGVNSTMRYLGGVAGIAILGQLLDLSGDRGTALHSHHVVLATFAVALVLGLGCALALSSRRVQPAITGRAGR